MKPIIVSPVNEAADEIELRGRELARKAAAEGFVLLKNDGVLPLEEKRVALFGSGARRTVVGGTGSGAMHERYSVSIEEGLEKAGFVISSKDWIDRCDAHYEAEYQKWHDHIEELVKDIANPFQALGIRNMNKFVYPTGIPVTAEDMQAADADTAIYVIARQAGEGNDRSAVKADYYPDDLERENLEAISRHYPKTLVVINCGGIVDASFMDEYKIGALMFYAQGGEEGGNAFADVVSGKQSPSGKLTDTWAMKYEEYPSAGHFSVETDPKVQDYREGIYVGYRYFDSFRVKPRYAFGYGLSYTDFAIETRYADVEQDKVRVRVQITNTGEKAGKEVVQLYATVPFGERGAEYQRLVTFVKTKELAPQECEELELTFALSELASYKEKTASYVLEAGSYILRVGNASDHTEPSVEIVVSENTVTEKCTNICPLQKELKEIVPPARSAEEEKCRFRITVDGSQIPCITHTYETLLVYGTSITDTVKGKIEGMTTEQLARLTIGSGIGSRNLVNAMGASGNTTSELHEDCGIPNIVLSDGPAGLNLTPRLVETKEGELKALDLYEQYNFGSFRKLMLQKLGKSEDGEVHYQYATALPCSTLAAQTWNVELMEELGSAVGAEMEKFGVTVWLAPGMNIHRNPLCGRVFEYYSEDPVLSGYMAAALTNGVQSHPGKGVSLKHFCANNSEVERDHSSSNMSERTLREIYLKGFETALKRCKAKTVMASYNKINEVYNPNNADILVKVLRNEWGFEGLVMSDWNAASAKSQTAEVTKAAASQCDLVMPGEAGQVEAIVEAVENGNLKIDDLKRAAARVLRLVEENTIVGVKW